MINKFKPDLVLGIAARNEEKTIYATLESLINEVKLFPQSISISVHIVLNGCVDETEQEIKRYISHHHHQNRVVINIKKIQNGLISAQQIIWKKKNKNNVIVFIDADIVFKQGSLYKLYEMVSQPSTRIVWANVTPVYKPKTRSLSITRILNFRDYFPKIFGVRKYVCGRVFSTKKYPLLISRSRHVSPIEKNIVKLLSLDKGPIVDDIYLTRYFRLTYGIDSIENCSTSVAYYNPITNITGA